MDKEFGRRCGEVRVAWGSLGAHTDVPTWATDLGASQWALYNLERGHRPRSGVSGLAERYASLREKGADPSALAAWAWTNKGVMPRPVNPDDAADPRNLTTVSKGREFTVMKGGALELELFRIAGRVKDAHEQGDTARARDLLDSLIKLGSEAKKLGLALFFVFALLFTPKEASALNAYSRSLQSVALPLGYAAVWARILRKLFGASKTRRAVPLPMPSVRSLSSVAAA